jgi:hypothetical protein
VRPGAVGAEPGDGCYSTNGTSAPVGSGARRRAAGGARVLEAEVTDDLRGHGGVEDHRDQGHAPAALRARQSVTAPRALEQRGPGEPARPLGIVRPLGDGGITTIVGARVQRNWGPRLT